MIVQITANFDQVAAELEIAAERIKKKLENMVAGFASEVVMAASSKTKVINADLLATSEKWQKIYQKRKEDTGIPIAPGFHAGAWRYYENQPTFSDPSIRAMSDAVANAYQEAKSNYRLGDLFSIGLVGPAASYAGPSSYLVEPLIVFAYKTDIVTYFDQG